MAARAKFQKSFNIKVTHDEEAGCFYVNAMEGQLVLHYQSEEEGVWHFTQLTTPTQMRNFGLTPRLIEYALETARKANLHIKLSCPTVQSYIARHACFKSS